jgi:hypothetical protein
MRKVAPNFVGTSLVAVALSILVVGVVWAGTSARQIFVNDSTETTFPTEGEIPDLIPDDSVPPSEMIEIIRELTATMAELEEKVDAYESDIAAARTEAAKAVADVAAATNAANDAIARVVKYEKRLSKLSDEGVYTGTITPAQLSRRLAATDVSGDWPLDRTSGELGGEKIKMTGSNCWSDYRYNVFIVPESFRGLSCLKVLK